MSHPNVRQTYKKHTTALVDFLFDNCLAILGPDTWSETLGPVPKDSTYRLQVKMFETCAKIVHDSTRLPKKISYGLLYDLDDNIRFRVVQSRGFRPTADTDATNRKTYETHMHFIRVLVNVRRLLRARANRADHRELIDLKPFVEEPETEISPSQGGSSFHVFAETLSEGSEGEGEGEDAVTGTSSTSNKTPAVSIDNLDSNSLAESAIIMICYLSEVRDIWRFCRHIWELYFGHHISLCTVAVITNIAYGLLRTSTETFIFEYADCLGSEEVDQKRMIQNYGALWSLYDTMEKLGIFDPNGDADSMSEEDVLKADIFWQPSVDVVMNYWASYRDEDFDKLELLRVTDTPGPITEPLNWNDSKTLARRFRQKIAMTNFLLREFVRHVMVVGRGANPQEVDELTYEFGGCLRKTYVGPWAPLGLQVLVNVHEAAGQGINRPWEEYNAIQAHIRSGVIERAPQYAKGSFRSLADSIGRCQHDDVASAASKRRRRIRQRANRKRKGKEPNADVDDRAEPAVGTKPPPFLLLKNNPVLCGLRVFRMLHDTTLISTSIANQGLEIHAAINCYNALKHSAAVSAVWHDAEFLIRHCGMAKIFNGPRPTTFDSALTCLQSIIYDKRPSRRRLGDTPFTDEVSKRIFGSGTLGTYYNNFRALIQVVLQRMEEDQRVAGILETTNDGSVADPTASGERTGEEKANEPATVPQPRKRNAKEYREYLFRIHESGRGRHGQFTPLPILQKITLLLNEEEVYIHWDHLSMHLRAQRLLEEMAEIYKRYPCGSDRKWDSPAPALLICCDFLEDCAKHPETKENKARLREISQLFESMIANEGRAEMDTVERLSGVKLGNKVLG